VSPWDNTYTLPGALFDFEHSSVKKWTGQSDGMVNFEAYIRLKTQLPRISTRIIVKFSNFELAVAAFSY
jgi:hypothetical protein